MSQEYIEVLEKLNKSLEAESLGLREFISMLKDINAINENIISELKTQVDSYKKQQCTLRQISEGQADLIEEARLKDRGAMPRTWIS